MFSNSTKSTKIMKASSRSAIYYLCSILGYYFNILTIFAWLQSSNHSTWLYMVRPTLALMDVSLFGCYFTRRYDILMSNPCSRSAFLCHNNPRTYIYRTLTLNVIVHRKMYFFIESKAEYKFKI